MFPQAQKFNMPTAQPFSMPQAQAQPAQVTPSVPVGAMSKNPQPLIPTANAATIPNTPKQAVDNSVDINAMYDQVKNLSSQVSKLSPNPYTVPSPTPTAPVNSNMLGSGATQNKLNDVWNSKANDLANGSNPNLTGSDNYMKNVANNVFQLSQYSPDEQNLIGSNQLLNAKIYNTQLETRRQIKQLQEDGQITKDQGASFISEAQRRSDAQLADQAGLGMYNTAELAALGNIRGNQLTAYQNLASLLKPEQVSPGSTMYNPILGTMYQGTGAAPAQITSYAQTLKQNDQMTGNLRLTPQGTVDDNYYYQTAQQAYATQGGSNGAPSSNSGAQTNGQPQELPQQVQTYLDASGGQYINADKVPAEQANIVKTLAAQNGVPFLSSDEVSKMRSIDVTQSNLQQLEGVTKQILGSGLTGRTLGAAWNNISSALQLNPNISSFNAFRDTAINTIQALAGGAGSGLRLNAGEISTAVGNLPTISDNLETAQKKISLVNGFLDKWKTELMQGSQPVTQSGNNVIQTKVGAVDNSWFN